MRYLWAILIVLFPFIDGVKANHVLGGEITWTCSGNAYVFELVFYRDCNGPEINTIAEDIKVWNHPSLTTVQVNFVSRTDISPYGTEVAGGPSCYHCGAGAGGGNGIGASEKILYRSNPIVISGVPPANGWVFTYDNFSRSSSISNLQSPETKGFTIRAVMYDAQGVSGQCQDNSPQFLQDPAFVTCAGEPFVYNMNVVDEDLDSLHLEFARPLDFLNGAAYNPPIVPQTLIFQTGYSYTSPTPSTTMHPLNIPATIDLVNGSLSFTSYTLGSFVIKFLVKSYRQGKLISEIEREMLISVVNCAPGNSAPTINAPFSGLWETTIDAGDPVTFTLTSTDPELLQDGSPQSNLMYPSGLIFGSDYINPFGCIIEPCATLSSAPTITGIQGATVDFFWQTSCDHVVDASGNALSVVPYHFVFKVQDDYCPTPKVSYATVTVNVRNKEVIPPTNIDCIQFDAAGNAIISWQPVTDPAGTFVEYQISSLQSGLVGTIPAISTSSFTHAAGGASEDYYVTVVSGCAGNAMTHSDTIASLGLLLNNPLNGTAELTWNAPASNLQIGWHDYYYISREYPSGVWTVIDSVPLGQEFYLDTIDICGADLGYMVTLSNTSCDFLSNQISDFFVDKITPDIPELVVATVDTTDFSVTIQWNVNAQLDTYGYIVYTLDENGFLTELDTVWGINNTSYNYFPVLSSGSLTYTVAAFDSCFTTSIPPTYQTSAKALLHSTVFIEGDTDPCSGLATLTWDSYVGWTSVSSKIFMQINQGIWIEIDEVSGTSYSYPITLGSSYTFAVQSFAMNGTSTFSNPLDLSIDNIPTPDWNYLKVATVQDSHILIKHTVDVNANIRELILEKDAGSGFVELMRLTPSPLTTFTDDDVIVNDQSYSYRMLYIDSCGYTSEPSNIGKTIHLTVSTREEDLINYVSWSAYEDFQGPLIKYILYRSIDGILDPTPLAELQPDRLVYEDPMDDSIFEGYVCYFVEAIEGPNVYNDSQISRSNMACATYKPLVYIPNAFVPDGVNKLFLPIVSIYNLESYELKIYDRWGEVIFKTDDPEMGWNGKIKQWNKMAETGTYIYMLELKDGGGNEHVYRGHVSVLR